MNNKLCAKAIEAIKPKGIIGSEIIFFDELTSTFDKIKQMPFSNGLTVVCAHQTEGCGRLGRSWESESGGVYFTFALEHTRNDFPLPFTTLVCAVGVCRVLSRYVPCDIKWPNDIVSGGKKLCGILTKNLYNEDKNNIILAGIGINVNNSFFHNLPYAASIKSLTGVTHNENIILSEVLQEIDNIYFSLSHGEIIKSYKELCINKGREITLVYADREVNGVCTDILPDGTMEVMSEGRTFAVNSGEVSVKGIYE